MTWRSRTFSPRIHLRHPAHSSTSELRVLIAVSPAINCSLNQAPLSTKTRVQIGKCPSHCITFRLVLQTVSSVLIFTTACSRIHAVLLLELCAEVISIHRLHVASDGVLHLDAVTRVLECDPLNAVVVLSHDKWGCRWNRSRCSVRVGAGSTRSSLMESVIRSGRSGRTSAWVDGSRWWSL